MKKKLIFKLDKEEREIESAIKRGLYVSTKNLKQEMFRARQIARNTLAKNKVINIRLTTPDYLRLKAKAMQEGIPYQTFITSLLHKEVFK